MHRRAIATVPSTSRIEAYSDGVFAIIVTLLVLELHVPELHETSIEGVLGALVPLLPKFASFAASFFTIAIFWVNHHSFFHMLRGSNAKILWLNNLLLFWLTVVPFTTAFLGDYPTVPTVVALYALTMGFAGGSFTLMGYYTFFHSDLIPSIPIEERRSEWRRSLIGTAIYLAAAIAALVYVYIALTILILTPLFFIIPRFLGRINAPEPTN